MAFALQADGWWLRSDIIWAKPNQMPESVTDRPTKSHEYLFLLTKSARYYYDAKAIAEPLSVPAHAPGNVKLDDSRRERPEDLQREWSTNGLRNARSVWTIATSPYPEAHFATFPPELPRRCILAGTSEKGCCPKCGAPWGRMVKHGEPENRRDPGGVVGKADAGMYAGRAGSRPTTTTGWEPSCDCYPNSEDAPDCFEPATVPCTVLDPFCGAGTTGLVADRLGRSFIGLELNPKYVKIARRRITSDAPLFHEVSE